MEERNRLAEQGLTSHSTQFRSFRRRAKQQENESAHKRYTTCREKMKTGAAGRRNCHHKPATTQKNITVNIK